MSLSGNWMQSMFVAAFYNPKYFMAVLAVGKAWVQVFYFNNDIMIMHPPLHGCWQMTWTKTNIQQIVALWFTWSQVITLPARRAWQSFKFVLFLIFPHVKTQKLGYCSWVKLLADTNPLLFSTICYTSFNPFYSRICQQNTHFITEISKVLTARLGIQNA